MRLCNRTILCCTNIASSWLKVEQHLGVSYFHEVQYCAAEPTDYSSCWSVHTYRGQSGVLYDDLIDAIQHPISHCILALQSTCSTSWMKFFHAKGMYVWIWYLDSLACVQTYPLRMFRYAHPFRMVHRNISPLGAKITSIAVTRVYAIETKKNNSKPVQRPVCTECSFYLSLYVCLEVISYQIWRISIFLGSRARLQSRIQVFLHKIIVFLSIIFLFYSFGHIF